MECGRESKLVRILDRILKVHFMNIEDTVVLLERNLQRHPFAGLLWERQIEEVLLELGWEKILNWECPLVHLKQGLFLSQNVNDIKMVGKKWNMAPMWKTWMKNVDLDEPTSYLDHGYLRCTQRECKPHETIIEQKMKMFESRFSLGATEKLPGWENPHAKTVAWSYDVEKHAQKCVERHIANWQTNKWSNDTKFQALAWMIINSSRKNSNQLEICQKFAHYLSYNVCAWHELDDLTLCGQSQACESKADFIHSPHKWLPTIL